LEDILRTSALGIAATSFLLKLKKQTSSIAHMHIDALLFNDKHKTVKRYSEKPDLKGNAQHIL